ncbi:Uncharacterised protein r2_g3328 [Pycnogonum litorale]
MDINGENVELLHGIGAESSDKLLNTWTAAVIIVGGACGAGIIMMPHNIQISGIFGIVFTLFVPAIILYSAYLLSRSFVMSLEISQPLDEETKTQILRSAYPFVGFVSYGNSVRVALRIMVIVNNFGASVVIFLIGTNNFQQLMVNIGFYYSICTWLIIMTILIIPFLWFDTPKNIWFLELAAFIFAFVTLCLVFSLFANGKTDVETAQVSYHRDVNIKDIQRSFTFVVYIYGSTSLYPSIQADMKHPKNFTYSLTLAYFVMFVFYTSLALVSYFHNPPNVNMNALFSLENAWIKGIGSALMALHILCSTVLFVNPVSQELEYFLSIDSKFGIKKVLLRTTIGIVLLLICETIPRFDVLMSFVTGLTIILLSVALPIIFYNKLISIIQLKHCDYATRKINICERISMVIIVLVFGLSACLSIYYSWFDIVKPNAFDKPCFLR